MIEAAKLLQAKNDMLALAINTFRQAHDKTVSGTQSLWETFERRWSEKGFDK